MTRLLFRIAIGCLAAVGSVTVPLPASGQPVTAREAMVVSQERTASQVGWEILREGGNAVDAAVATAFALAVTHPAAGNIGGGGFLLWRPASGEAAAYDFREMAPSGAHPAMFLVDGRYDTTRHHQGHLSVGVPGTVAGLHLAWSEQGRLPWKRLVAPAIQLARRGFKVTPELARSLQGVLPDLNRYPASRKQFTKDGQPYQAGDLLQQPDLARTLERIAESGPPGFYQGETARLIEEEMLANGGLITRRDLESYRAWRREPLRGRYRGYDILSMPPPSSGGTVLIQMLNILEGYDLKAAGFGSALNVHLMVEAMRRGFAARACFLGDPEANPGMPVARLISKEYAAELRKTISLDQASVSRPDQFEWPVESEQTTHLSVVDRERNAVALTYTLEHGYGSRIVVSGAGFLLNNEMGDFNAGPGLTTREGLIGTSANLARPGRRMLSSMTPTIVEREGKPVLVVGSPGGRTIINTVLQILLNIIDYGMNVQQAVDKGRIHHQWLPDRIRYEAFGLSPDTLSLLVRRGHSLEQVRSQGVVQAIYYNAENDLLQGASDRRDPGGGVAGE